MEEVSSFVGIDVAQDQLALAVRPGGEAREVPNTDEGIKSIIGFIQELGPHLVVLEATGGMHIHLVAELASAGVAPWSIRGRCGTLPGLRGSWPRPMPWTPMCWPTLPKPYSPNRGPCPMPQCGNWVPW